jgi:hypothetical protein
MSLLLLDMHLEESFRVFQERVQTCLGAEVNDLALVFNVRVISRITGDDTPAYGFRRGWI